MKEPPWSWKYFFCSKEGALWAYIYLGCAFQLDTLLHFCVRVQIMAAMTASFRYTYMYLAAGTTVPKWLVGHLVTHQKLKQNDTVLAPF